MKNNVLITGGSGLLGQAISSYLEEANYQVALLSRNPEAQDKRAFYWDYETNDLDEEALDFADIIIHLAGENISKGRWTHHQKNKIIDSRVKTTALLYNALQKKQKKLTAFISASAIGYYGSESSERILEETDRPGNDFLAQTVKKWEESVHMISNLGIPTSILRIGVVMSNNGGALPKMMAPVNWGLAAAIGSGKQWVPWIALDDLARLFTFVLEVKLPLQTSQKALIYNAVAPNFIRNNELMRVLAKVNNKPFFMPAIPAFVFRLIYGEMSMILLEGSRISSEKIIKEGFKFNVKRIDGLFNVEMI